MAAGDERTVRRGLLGRLRSAQGWIAVFSLLAVVGVAVVDAERTSPGPLAAVHGGVPALEAGTSCASCHGGYFSGMTESCLECHAPIEAQLEAGEGVHGLLAGADGERCALCHSEHHGADFALVNAQSFARVGVPDRAAFDHATIGFPMDGRHLELTCAECHVNADVDVLAEGQHRYLGLDPSCVRCHDDPHEGRMVRECAECHTQTSFEDLHARGHEQHLPLVGGHRGLDCRACHAEDHERSLEKLARGLRGREPRDCAACHAAPHDEQFLARVARRTGGEPGASCGECHVEEHTSFAGDGAPEPLDAALRALVRATEPRTLAARVTPRLHAASGFELSVPHDDVACAECHDPGERSFAERFPGRDAEGCSACHEDPHGGQFEQGLFAGQECTACHAREAFGPHAFDVEAHAATAFPLQATHATTDCAACHLEPPGQPRRFHGTPGRCEDCHSDAHAGFFDASLAALAEPRAAGTCSECHVPTRFADVPLGDLDEAAAGVADAAGRPFLHEPWTGFPLRGAHRQTDCAACHAASAEVDEHGRRFGRVHARFGPFEGCTTCHADPHAGAFDARALPARHQGREGCLRCHVEASFRALPHGFDHELWTGFELEGAHEAAACEACHAPLRTPAANGRTWAPAAGEDCSACHADPHAGQFDVAGVTDCARCHHTAEGFERLRFDHDRHSRFALGESHADLACSACHVAYDLDDGSELVRYRPLETDCASCHGSQEGPTLRRRTRRDR